jgi:hypothetical protein
MVCDCVCSITIKDTAKKKKEAQTTTYDGVKLFFQPSYGFPSQPLRSIQLAQNANHK